MVRNLFAAVMIMTVCAATTLVAQQNEFQVARNRATSVDYYVTNYGIFGHNVAGADPGFSYPRGGNKSYIFGSGIWFGTMKSVSDTLRPLAFIGYNPNSGNSWATPGDTDPLGLDHHLHYAGDHDPTTGAYVGAGAGLTWPLWAVDGMSVSPRTPGVWVADVDARKSGSGLDRPAYMPNVAEQFVSRFHDGNLALYEGFGSEFGFPIGLQFQQNVYSWGPLNNYQSVVVLQYEVTNISIDTLFGCVIGQASDPDLGSANNDQTAVYRGSNGQVRAGVTTTGRETGVEYEALAQILIEAPSIGSDGFIDNSLRPAQLTEHEIGTWRKWTLEDDPATLADRYTWMLGPTLDDDANAGDKRTMLATRAFNMAPGDTAHFSMAFAVVPTPFGKTRSGDENELHGAGSPEVLDALIASLISDYATGAFSPFSASSAVDESRIASQLSVAPNPAGDNASVTFSMPTAGTVEIAIVSAMGQRLASTSLGRLDAGAHHASLDVADLSAGTYLVIVDANGARRSTMLTITR